MEKPINTPLAEGWTRYKDALPTKKDSWIITVQTFRTRPSMVKIDKYSPWLADYFSSKDTYEGILPMLSHQWSAVRSSLGPKVACLSKNERCCKNSEY